MTGAVQSEPSAASFRQQLFWLTLVLAATLVFGSVSLIYPFGRDQGIHAYIASAALQGVTMYKDILMGVLPMTVMVHWLALVLFGHSMFALRLLDLLWTMATALCIFFFVQRAFRRSGFAALAAICYSVFYYNYNFWHSAQNDGFMNLPLAAALMIIAADGSERKPLPAVFAGLFLGWALFFKYTILLLLPGVLLVVLGRNGWRSPAAWRSASLLLAGSLAAVLAVIAIMAVSGALPGFIEGQTRLAMPYAGVESARPGFWSQFLQLVQSFTRPPDNIIPVLLGTLGLIPASAILLERQPTGSTGIGLIFSWLLAALFSVIIQGKYFYYHYLPLLPPLAVLSGLALDTLLQPVKKWFRTSWRRVGLTAGGVLAVIIGTSYADRFRDLTGVVLGTMAYSDYLTSSRFVTNDFSLAEQSALADYLAAETEPAEQIFVWGLDPLIGFLSRRQIATRFIYNFPLVSAWARPEYRDELLLQLRARPPAVFIVTHRDRLPWVTGHNRDSYEALMDISSLRQFLLENYELETRIGSYDVLRRMNSDELLPVRGLPAELVEQDLKEALEWLTRQAGRSEPVPTLIWPGRMPVTLPAALRPHFISHRELNHKLWLQDTTLQDLLPAWSVWIKGDDRPLASQEPFGFQNEGHNFIFGDYRFTVIHRCRNGLVMIYDVRQKTGTEITVER